MEKKSFETALKELELIVSEMEGGDLALDESLKKYEEGIHLSQFCKKELDRAEKKIEILLKKTDGSTELVDFNPQPTVQESPIVQEPSSKTTDVSTEVKENNEVAPNLNLASDTKHEPDSQSEETAQEKNEPNDLSTEIPIKTEKDIETPSTELEHHSDNTLPEQSKKHYPKNEATEDFLF
ncbi:exodeoxyribonuclease VII small subunit [bacterium]|nr:exodeoxyribonuclease VII small subunit [bacterium]